MDDGDGLPSDDTVANLRFEHDANRQIDRVAFALSASTERHAGSGDSQRIQSAKVAIGI